MIEEEYLTLLNMNKNQIDRLKMIKAKNFKDESIQRADQDIWGVKQNYKTIQTKYASVKDVKKHTSQSMHLLEE